MVPVFCWNSFGQVKWAREKMSPFSFHKAKLVCMYVFKMLSSYFSFLILFFILYKSNISYSFMISVRVQGLETSFVVRCHQKASLCWKKKEEKLLQMMVLVENKLSGQVNGRRLSILRSYFCSSLSFSYEVSSLAY